MHRILFVCLGNICRSPTAEAVTRAKAPHLHLDSAGTAGYHVGDPPYGPMQQAARGRGYDLSPLRARQFTADDFDTFDVIIAMDGENFDNIEALRPTHSSTPVVLFTDHIGQDCTAVPDPYYTRDFNGCLDLIEACADGLIAGLTR
ncbi:low molecular weight protein-tyrosine-phosphatase [Octadecabacter sp. 1_MG-2023]|uniref:low molecular weight protein-tyrosine-phosphatase n=1 Tax=unclassified Octadecabacter TaxID=196158 RepID=UPI001C096995|nr:MULTISPECIES: low molecular weight protein-tyrosine-phosphatase [unclassified Octadecabacter]MBU2994702.1 low molecular weight phosphotyrosine protein phosphatase [Octadecabacter sp. B2R22]MDO6734004.1 low molecular weight protein-tyrosine-phosphatase [Octadecabacter sp. 1_MG-2023]